MRSVVPRRAAGRRWSASSPAGFPDRASFASQLAEVAEAADVVEIGVPFSDPMADGLTIQRSSRVALEQGATLAWILEALAALAPRPRAPLVLMSYLNPLLAHGLHRLPAEARAAGVSGLHRAGPAVGGERGTARRARARGTRAGAAGDAADARARAWRCSRASRRDSSMR